MWYVICTYRSGISFICHYLGKQLTVISLYCIFTHLIRTNYKLSVIYFQFCGFYTIFY
jgi:hypothetical protein